MRYKAHAIVAFEFEGEIAGAVDCNCSICSKKGALLWAVPREKLRLLTPETELSRYTLQLDGRAL